MMETENKDLDFLCDLPVNNKNNLRELEEALELIHSYKSLDDIDHIDRLRENLAFIDLFFGNERNIKLIHMKMILRIVRKLWFLEGEESEELSIMFNEYLKNQIGNVLKEIYQPSDYETRDDQMRKCTYLLMLFSYCYDDPKILGICRYDYLFVIFLATMLSELTNKLIKENNIHTENFYHLIYLMDKMISNWLDIFNQVDDKSQYRQNFLDRLKNNLCVLTDRCKDRYKLISLALGTIVANIQKLENLLTPLDVNM